MVTGVGQEKISGGLTSKNLVSLDTGYDHLNNMGQAFLGVDSRLRRGRGDTRSN